MEQDRSALEIFISLCLKAKSADELDRFFDLFFTIEEKNTLASRCLIIKELLEGKLTQREIAKTHNVSIAQITRGSNALKRIDLEMDKFLKKEML